MRLLAASLAILLILLDISSRADSAAKKSKKKITQQQQQSFPDSMMVLQDLSQLSALQNELRQAGAAPVVTAGISQVASNASSGTATVSATRQGPCQCGGGLCACCSRILLNLWRQKACVNVTYDPDEFAFTAKLSMNDKLLYTRTVSGKNPRPVCVPVPRIPAVRACVRFYNIYFQGRNVHACVNMEGKFRDTTLFKVGMDCLRLGANGVALVKPEDGGGIGQVEFLPDDPDGGESGEDDDGYDDYDDDDDGEDDDLFDY